MNGNGQAYQDFDGLRFDVPADMAFDLSGDLGVPEPATVALIGAGLGALGLVRLRRK